MRKVPRSELRDVLARNLRLLRAGGRVAQEALAFESGVNRTYISSIEKAANNLTIDNLARLGRGLGVAPWNLINPHFLELKAFRVHSLNELNVLGHVGADPKVFGKVTKLSVATDRSWTDRTGARQEATDWVPVTILDQKRAEWVAKNVKRGDRIFARCRVAEASFEKNGERIYTVDVIASTIILLASRGSADEDPDATDASTASE